MRDQGVGEAAEQISLGTSCREGETDAAGRLDDTGCDFEKPEPDGGELGRGQIARLRDSVAHGEDEPIGGGVEDEADLVGERRAALRFVRICAAWFVTFAGAGPTRTSPSAATAITPAPRR